MLFVPVTPYVPPPPSPLAQELGRRIATTIEQFARENPGLKSIEIQQALRLAARREGASSKAVASVLALLVALLLLGAMLFWFVMR